MTVLNLMKIKFSKRIENTKGKGLLQAISSFPSVFSSPEHEVLRVSYCDHSPSVSVRLSVWPAGRASVRRPFTFPCLHSSIYKY